MKKLEGKIALVTGAGRGIGAAIARRLAADGAEVGIHYANSAETAENLAEALRVEGGRAFTVQGDLASLEDIDRMAAALRERPGALDILVNNAGRGSGRGDSTLANMPVEDYDMIFALNTRGLFFVTQRLLPLLRDDGRIINFGSTGATARVRGLAAYAGSKAAVEAFTRIWATELAPRRITVNTILPGMIDTDLITDNMGEEVKAVAARHHPWGRIGQPEDMADVVAFLASEDSRWVNGETIVASGGV
ncbi:MAG: SDR family oxidoreductase [Novosphingobium sp.]|nr:SDR family oxidoreductase [Novosphingobium sp.]